MVLEGTKLTEKLKCRSVCVWEEPLDPEEWTGLCLSGNITD